MSLTRHKLRELSKAVSHALRHEPLLYELELDDEKWVSVDHLIRGLQTERAGWQGLTRDDLAEG